MIQNQTDAESQQQLTKKKKKPKKKDKNTENGPWQDDLGDKHLQQRSTEIKASQDKEFMKQLERVSKKHANIAKQKIKQRQQSHQQDEEQQQFKGKAAPITITRLEYLEKRAGRTLSAKEQDFIEFKVEEHQHYEKEIRQSKFGFNKRQLAKINCETIVDKCIQFGFDEDKFEKWISALREQDRWLAENVQPNERDKITSKMSDLYRQTDLYKYQQAYKQENEKANESERKRKMYQQQDGHKAAGEWCIQRSEGEKHSERIKVLNAVKRNEAFEDRFEETREEREERIELANKKRELLLKFQQAQQNSNASHVAPTIHNGNYNQHFYKVNGLHDPEAEEREYQERFKRQQKMMELRNRQKEGGKNCYDTSESEDGDGSSTADQESKPVVVNGSAQSSEESEVKQPLPSSGPMETGVINSINGRVRIPNNFLLKKNYYNHGPPQPIIQEIAQPVAPKQSEPAKPKVEAVPQKQKEPKQQFPNYEALFNNQPDSTQTNQPVYDMYKQSSNIQKEQTQKSVPNKSNFDAWSTRDQKELRNDYEYDDYYDEEDYGQEYDERPSYNYYNPSYHHSNKHQEGAKHPKYKTDMCRRIVEYGECTYPNCSFAHSQKELAKYKQKMERNNQKFAQQQEKNMVTWGHAGKSTKFFNLAYE